MSCGSDWVPVDQSVAMSNVMDPYVLQEVEDESEASTSCDTGMDEEEEDDGEPKICRVCGDRATGYHFNAMTCEGCKGFFRRAMKRSIHLICPFQRSCVITKNNRRQCQACRLRKCLDIGMLKELIMTDEAVENRRALIKRKKQLRRAPSPALEETGLTGEQQRLIQELTEAQDRTFDKSFDHFHHFRPIRRECCSSWDTIEQYVFTSYGQIWRRRSGSSSSEDPNLSNPQQDVTEPMGHDSSPTPQITDARDQRKVFCMLPHVADLSTYMIKGVISFAKVSPYFRWYFWTSALSYYLLHTRGSRTNLGSRNLLKTGTVNSPLPLMMSITCRPDIHHGCPQPSTENSSNATGSGRKCGFPVRRQLSIEDQIALLKGATFELCQIRFNTLFNPTSGIWECGKLEYNINDASLAGFKELLLNPLLKFHYMLKKLDLQNEEYVLMQAISLFSPDRPGVKHSQSIDQLQEMFALTLKAYIDTKHSQPKNKFLFPKIIQCLTELRSMNVEYCKQVVEIHDIQPDNTPLMMEVFSLTND